MPRMSSPKQFNEPILQQLRREKQIAEKGDGTLPIMASWKKVLEEDEKQLDLLQGKRGHIFESKRTSMQPVLSSKKKLLPSMKAHNTKALLSPHQRDSSIESSLELATDYKPNEAVISLVAPPRKPVHEKAQVQQQYSRMRQVLREKERHEAKAKTAALKVPEITINGGEEGRLSRAGAVISEMDSASVEFGTDRAQSPAA